ncbi:hypothetical protein H6P81_016328 [Aristolochia fimbriata]|uniref:Beta-Casp domain-containing protein n=1 Tax=Aristolochia fimbriata TaxID=158543 RepID=A0AAV7E8E7_ARIFI|nr:hypothetical protein H6P81_016328 [Aristolochia fimbriata]
MKLTCLSQGKGFYFPPSHVLDICGFKILIDCPIDLSTLTIFSPVPFDYNQCVEAQISSDGDSPNSSSGSFKRRRVEKYLEVSDLVCAEPWYKTALNWKLTDVSLIDVVLISSPMAMLGLPFLTRIKEASAKIYATEAAAKLGCLMMEDLVSMHAEYRQYYGPAESGVPHWMEELEALSPVLREIVLGKENTNLGHWQSMYSGCQRVHEENSDTEGAIYLSSSSFVSAHAMDFDYHSLQGNDVIIFSDFSYLHGGKVERKSVGHGSLDLSCSAYNEREAQMVPLVDSDEGSEEVDKLAFISSCIVNTVEQGGSAMIPIGQLGVILLLVEQISLSLEALNLKIPIYMISSVAEETLAFTSIIPEWVSKQRQHKLFSGEALFGHIDLVKEKKLHLFSGIWSSEFVTAWQEPCIVFSPHWSLRLGPVIHLLRRWHEDPRSLLVLEGGVDAELALLPFKPVAMKVLQCSFLSGIRVNKIQPLLENLQPKLVLFPKDLESLLASENMNSTPLLYYCENETLRVPRLSDYYEADMETDLAFQLKPKRMRERDAAMARLRGKLEIICGKYFLVSTNSSPDASQNQLLHWGSIDPDLLLAALKRKGIEGYLRKDTEIAEENYLVQVEQPAKAVIDISRTRTVISMTDNTLVANILQAIESVVDSI